MKFRELSKFQKFLQIVGGAAVGVVTIAVIRRQFRREGEKPVYPRDTVILHQIGRGPFAPSLTPFAVKLETYLRMANIPYQNVHGMRSSPKGKVPWIEYNGEEMGDTTLCIKFLNEKYNVDFNKHLSPLEKAQAVSMQVMTEEHLYWCLALFRWVHATDKSMVTDAVGNKFFSWYAERRVKSSARSQGMGRHSRAEVAWFMERDLQALADFLGEKKFLMGEEPCETDCAVFGMLSQLHWQSQGTGFEQFMKDTHPKLAAYCERMRARFWPDWDECTAKGQQKALTWKQPGKAT